MQGMSERQYAARVGLSRGAIQKAKAAGRLVLLLDGVGQRRGQRHPSRRDDRPVQDEEGARRRSSNPSPRRRSPRSATRCANRVWRRRRVGSGTTFLQAKTANEVLKAQERRIRLQKLKGELIERARALSLVFRLARQERDVWVNWPARAAALMAADLGVEPAAMQKVLEKHVRAQLDDLAEVRPDLR